MGVVVCGSDWPYAGLVGCPCAPSDRPARTHALGCRMDGAAGQFRCLREFSHGSAAHDSSVFGRSTVACLSLSAFALLFLIGPILLVPRLHPYAAILLALGIATQAGRILARRIDRFDTIVRRTLPGLLCLSAVLGIGLHVSRGLTEARVDASQPPSQISAQCVADCARHGSGTKPQSLRIRTPDLTTPRQIC